MASPFLREDIIKKNSDLGSFDYEKFFFPMVPPLPPVRVRSFSRPSESKDELVPPPTFSISSATLFVNDYHVEDGCDPRSSPKKYTQHILDLQEQGHLFCYSFCSALDKLGTLGLPVWFTELDVSSTNEYVRADDLKVMLREGEPRHRWCHAVGILGFVYEPRQFALGECRR